MTLFSPSLFLSSLHSSFDSSSSNFSDLNELDTGAKTKHGRQISEELGKSPPNSLYVGKRVLLSTSTSRITE